MKSTKDEAIACALKNDWKNAQKINESLLKESPNDIDTLNRLAFALMKLGKYAKSKKIYKQTIALDKTNPIAIKNIKRLETVSKQKVSSNGAAPSDFSVETFQLSDKFIEEAGKTKTLELKNCADKKTLSLIQPGDTVHLIIKRSKIFVQNGDKKYIGMLPDNIGVRLISFMKGGNAYSACIKSIGEHSATIFIKEIKKASRFKNQPSFANNLAPLK